MPSIAKDHLVQDMTYLPGANRVQNVLLLAYSRKDKKMVFWLRVTDILSQELDESCNNLPAPTLQRSAFRGAVMDARKLKS